MNEVEELRAQLVQITFERDQALAGKEKIEQEYTEFVQNIIHAEKKRDELTKERHKLGVTPEAAAWVISKVVEAIDIGPSFRGFIYGLMGFGPESYTPLYLAGGMAFTNAITTAGLDASVSVRHAERRARRWEREARRQYAAVREAVKKEREACAAIADAVFAAAERAPCSDRDQIKLAKLYGSACAAESIAADIRARD